ncbi:hypothetical protein A0J61_09236 [Choanephora cucurbitarum]|uniref:Uncharacterized protein n=1 Tax=Choanephora cucurbitarum TaxID=101091 RepID=A0A1C7N0W1_9FUNG|nr:hypothetical protein A0J61_09236 [Choanephora cucurbitarum]
MANKDARWSAPGSVTICDLFRIGLLLDPVSTDVDGLLRLQPDYGPVGGAPSRTDETDVNARTGIATEIWTEEDLDVIEDEGTE